MQNSDKTSFFDEIEEYLLRAEKDLKEVKRFGKRLKEIDKNLRKLSTYYHTDWLEDIDNYNGKHHYKMMEEDAIWNTTQEHYEQKLRLLKTLINAINKRF